MDEIEFWQAGEWTMVYLNGELQWAGDHYLADEWLQERCGVTVVEDEDSVSVPDGHNALETLDEARAALDARAARHAEADTKRVRARRLLAEADALDKGKP